MTTPTAAKPPLTDAQCNGILTDYIATVLDVRQPLSDGTANPAATRTQLQSHVSNAIDGGCQNTQAVTSSGQLSDLNVPAMMGRIAAGERARIQTPAATQVYTPIIQQVAPFRPK